MLQVLLDYIKLNLQGSMMISTLFIERFNNMNNIEIQREENIKIVGTQYNERAINHKGLVFQQKLLMKHQHDNPYDNNAVIILTIEGKELGFMPKGYASIYAPAIDSGKYSFIVEVFKSEFYIDRPILIVKVISERCNYSEQEIENNILKFVQNIINNYVQRKTEYLNFIQSESVDLDELITSLNMVRIVQKLYSLSDDIIKNNKIEQSDSEFKLYTKEELIKNIDDLKTYINDVLRKIQKAYNETLDIDDEDEYNRVQSVLRGRRKKFRLYDELFTSYHEVVEKYVDVEAICPNNKLNIANNEYNETNLVQDNVLISSEPKPKSLAKESADFNEQLFPTGLATDRDVSETTAKQYIIVRLCQTLLEVRKNIIKTTYVDNVKPMTESLIIKNDDNKKNYQPLINSKIYTIKTIDFENINDCKYCKPCSFILNGVKRSVRSWCDLYIKFLSLLYNDNVYVQILNGLIGESLYGRKIDFADKTLLPHLRKPIKISPNFFAESNLSANDIVKHIKYLMELCSIDNEHMTIEYKAFEKDDEVVADDESINNISSNHEKSSKESIVDKSVSPALTQKTDESYVPIIDSFMPDTTKPFVLKDAVIEILLSNTAVINKWRAYKNGISIYGLQQLIRNYYGKAISPFELVKLLMFDKTFKPVGNGYYILNTDTLLETKEITKLEQSEEKPVSDTLIEKSKTDYTSEGHISQSIKDIILDVIKQNSDNILYTYGFSSYEVKTLLANKGFNIAENDIEILLSECPELKEIDDGYYILNDSSKTTEPNQTEIIKYEEPKLTEKEKTSEKNISETRRVVLNINKNTVRAYDCSDALNKICEFAINCKPFRMARIAGQGIQIHGNNVFYRTAVPVNGYNKLSNGLQIIAIDNISDLRIITDEVKKYCQIDDDMIEIFSE